MKHRADKDLFNIAWRGLLADILGQNCRQVGAQEFLLEVACITLVLQVFEKHDRNCNVADSIETKHEDGPRNRADVAPAGLPIENRIDESQNLVGQ